MTTRTRLARAAQLALGGLLSLLIVPAGSLAASSPTAQLRVLTPTGVLDPGTNYVLEPQSVATDPQARCNFGGAGGSGQTFQFQDPTALSLLASGAASRGSLRPLSVTDEFGFGLAVCAIGGVDDTEGTFWYFKKNRIELAVGADQEPVSDGDEVLVYLAPDVFPQPNVKELELIAPARVPTAEQIEVSVVEHGCVTDPNTFAISCDSLPAAGVTITGAGAPVTTAADGTATIPGQDAGRLKLAATRAPEIPSEALKVCVSLAVLDCPPVFGERYIGTSGVDRIATTRGEDKVSSGQGNDKVDIRKGARDSVDCGPGEDTVLVKRTDTDDKIKGSCERIRRR